MKGVKLLVRAFGTLSGVDTPKAMIRQKLLEVMLLEPADADAHASAAVTGLCGPRIDGAIGPGAAQTGRLHHGSHGVGWELGAGVGLVPLLVPMKPQG